MSNPSKTTNEEEFINEVFANLTYPSPKENYAIEIIGKISYISSHRDGKKYEFTATSRSGIIYHGTREMQDNQVFSMEYEIQHGDDKGDEEEEIGIRLKSIVEKLKEKQRNPKVVPASARKKTLESELDKQKGIIRIRLKQ